MVRHGYPPCTGLAVTVRATTFTPTTPGPDNIVVEYMTALDQVTDENSQVPRAWPATPDYADRRGTTGPGEDLFALWNRTAPEPGAWTGAPV